MDISKTKFKEYSKCLSFYNLDKIYYNHKLDDEKYQDVIEILSRMFDEEGEDLIFKKDEKVEAMLPYYEETEKQAVEEAKRTFGKEFVYHKNNKEQVMISYKNINGFNLYTYLDAYFEDDEIYIIEVKATTSRKFLELKAGKGKAAKPLFEKNKNIISVRKNLKEEDIKNINKLYDKYDDTGKYFYDLAITKFIFDKYKNNKKVHYYLAILNKDYIKDITSNEEKLICFVDANEILNNYTDILNKDYNLICETINQKKLDKMSYEKACTDCTYKKICFPKLTEKNAITTLFNSRNIGGKTLKEIINNGIYNIKDIPIDLLTNENQRIQRNCIDSHQEYIDKITIRNLIDNIKYPVYHLDFESFSSPIPRFFGEKPYTQSVFQFSIHCEKEKGKCDMKKDNYYFLPYDFKDHRKELVQEMIKIIDLSKGGTVLVYNKSFEYNRIKELSEIFPQYKNELMEINNHMFDLYDVIRGSGQGHINYYHENMQGSLSIKKVLPQFSQLSYKELDVQNGNEAVISYVKLKEYESENVQDNMQNIEISEIRKELIEYCGLDTYSMFVILNVLRGRIQ